MTTDAFIDLLEQQQLVSSRVVRQLRAKLAEGDARVTPQSILKYLVKKEHLSRAQAKELLETTIVVSDKAESSILGLVPLADVPDAAAKPVRPAPSPPAPTAAPKLPRTPAEPAAKPAAPVRSPDDDLFAPIPAAPFGAPPDDEIVPLDPVEDDALAAPEARSAPGSRLRAAPRPKKGKRKAKPKRSATSPGKSEWDSPLLLMGGGGLAVLIVASVILWFLVFRESADKALKLANDAFDRGNYAQAAELYEAFVDKHAGHQSYSYAKIRQQMSPLWEAAESRNYAGAADMAPGVVSAIENEPAFSADPNDPDGLSAAKRELSTLLTTIAGGLAEQAESAESDDVASQRIAQLKTVLEMTSNNKYVPPKLRLDSKLAEAAAALKRVEQREQRDSDLRAALTAMDQALQRGAPAEALAVRATLLTNHPVLVSDATLAAKVVDVSAAEKSGIKFVDQRTPALTEPAPSPVVAELALADNRAAAAAAPGAAPQPLVFRIDGALFGLDALGGAVLWRRFVGLDGSAPALLPSGQVVAADAQRSELLCVASATGKPLWRLPLEGKLATPLLAGERLLVASDAGKLFVVEAASGELLGHIPFSQPLRTPPAASERGDQLYVLGEHSNLYTLSGADYSCLGVHYLGHAAGGVTTPPVVVLNKVLVADNSGAETSLIRAINVNNEGVADGEAASHRLSGLVLTPLSVAGRRVAAVSTLGQAAVFEISGAADKTALTVLAGREAQVQQPLAQFGLLHDGHLWVAGRQLAKLAVLPTGNQLPVRSLDRDFRGDAFDAPLQVHDKLLIHVRRPDGRPGAIVAATDDEARPVWETSLSAAPAGVPAVDETGLRITAGAASGLVFLLDREAMTRRVQNQAARLEEPAAETATFTDALALPGGRLVLGGDGARLLHFRPDDPRQALRAVDLPGPLSGPPVAWRNGFAAATSVGQVVLLAAEDASPLAAPFQPELTPGEPLHWLRPAVAGADAESPLVISDGAKKLYLLNVQPQPQPHLAAVASVDVGASPLATPLAVAGSRVFAGNAAGQLASFALPALTVHEPTPLGSPVAWGPHAVAGGVLLSTESDELILVGDDGAIRWRQPLKHGQLGGVPLVDGEQALLLAPATGVSRISLSDGAEAAFAELGQPAVAGPVAFGPRLVVAAPGGALLVVNRP